MMLHGKKRQHYEMDMCNGSILKKMLLFAFPLMFSNILQLLFNAADIIVVGNFAGDNSLAAVGSNTALINLLTNLFIGLSIGANVLVARYYGADKKDELKDTVHTAMLLSFISGCILMVIGVIFARYLLILMQTPDKILSLATLYLRIYFLGMPAMMVYNFGSAILRAVGDTKRPLYFLFAAGVVNIALNLLLVIVFKLDVAGVAIATVISETISATLVVMCLIRDKSVIHLDIKKLRIRANIEGFVYMAMNTFHHATLSFTGQNYGAGRMDRIKKILFTGQGCVIVTGMLLGQLAVLLGRPLLGIYTDNPVAVDAGMVRLQIICGTYALCGMMDVMVGSIRGLGYAVLPMVVSLVGACGLRLVWIATIFRIPEFHTTKVIYASYPITWIITFAAHVICFVIIWNKIKKKNTPNIN